MNDLDLLELEIQSDIGNIVEGALPEVKPHDLVGAGILIANRANTCTRRNLTHEQRLELELQ